MSSGGEGDVLWCSTKYVCRVESLQQSMEPQPSMSRSPQTQTQRNNFGRQRARRWRARTHRPASVWIIMSKHGGASVCRQEASPDMEAGLAKWPWPMTGLGVRGRKSSWKTSKRRRPASGKPVAPQPPSLALYPVSCLPHLSIAMLARFTLVSARIAGAARNAVSKTATVRSSHCPRLDDDDDSTARPQSSSLHPRPQSRHRPEIHQTHLLTRRPHSALPLPPAPRRLRNGRPTLSPRHPAPSPSAPSPGTTLNSSALHTP